MLFIKYSNTVLILETESVKEVSLILMFTCSYPRSPKTKKNEYDSSNEATVYNYCLCFHDTSIFKHKEEKKYVISTLSDPQLFSFLTADCN